VAARRFLLIAASCVFLIIPVFCQIAASDPCLVVYPDGPCVYYYDPAKYYTVGPGSPYYNPAYDRGGKVLLEIGTNQVDLSIYQAPGLNGFVSTPNGDEGYYFTGTNFQLIIDGFSRAPATYVNILVVFDKAVPTGCVPTIYVAGSRLTGGVYHAGDLVVQTPAPNGNNYSDVKKVAVNVVGCNGVHVWAYSDENYNGAKDGGECFTAYSHDLTVPVEFSSWGKIKALYR